MVTVKKFLKMQKANEEELNKMIDSMSEDDAKAYLKAVMKVIKQNPSFATLDNI